MKLPELPVRPRTILLGVVVIAVSFFVSLKAMDWLSPGAKLAAPQLAHLPPLPPSPRSSVVIAPIAISLTAIREAAERGAPKNFAGKADNPVSQLLQDADIGWTASRGSIAATGAQDALTLSTPLTGKISVTGSLTSKATGAVGDAIGGLLGADAAKRIGSVNIKAINATAEIRGNVVITMRPRLAQTWHVEPNFGAQVILGDTSLVLAGAKVNVPTQVKPVIDKTVGEQLNAVSERIRNDKTLERAAREQWAKACRSMSLQGTGTTASLPALWLELKPIRAVAAQPIVNATAVTVAVGIEAESRITPTETKPNCPFPDKISIVPPTAAGIGIGVPIDLPFTELDKILGAQLGGGTVPGGGPGAGHVTGQERK